MQSTMRGKESHCYRYGFINGLKYENKHLTRKEEKNYGKFLAIFLLGMLLLSVVAVLAWQSGNANTVRIDGNFDDWQAIAKTTKPRDLSVPENIDIAEYATAETGKNIAFYAKVYGKMLEGDGRYIVEVPSGNPVYVAQQRETAIPNANGRDVAYVFIDTDNNPNTGFKPSQNFPVGADKAIEIAGKNGKIEISRVLSFAGIVQQEWTWNIGESVAAATNGKELEAMAGKNLLGIGEKYAVYFYMIDWQNRGSISTQTVRTSFHDITVDGDLGEWQADENMGGRDNVNWYFTWNASMLFVGVDRGEPFHGSPEEDVIWIYLNTSDGGGNISVDWSGRHNLSFYADWCLVYAPTQPYWNLRKWDAGTGDWLADQYYSGSVASALQTAEISIPLADVGNPTGIDVLFYMTNGANNYLFGASPRENPTGASPQTLLSYWIEPSLGSGISPNGAMKGTGAIHINGESELSTKASDWGWQGDGSQSNPYIIEKYAVDAKGGKWGIYIENTTSYITIRNCTITNQTWGSAPGAGIALRNVSNAIVENNTLTNVYHGMRIDTWSEHNIVRRNIVYPAQRGIYLYQANYTEIVDNEVYGGITAGIYLNAAKYANVTNNRISGSYNGTQVYSSSNCNISYNNISNSGNFGMYIYSGSTAILVTYNDFYHNTKYAINVTTTGNTFHHNMFIANNGAGRGTTDGISQAYDSGGGNFWYDNIAKEGNYWSNWDGNGWGTASAYPIDGSAGASDYYPWGGPTPEFSGIGVLFALPLLGILCLARRKQK